MRMQYLTISKIWLKDMAIGLDKLSKLDKLDKLDSIDEKLSNIDSKLDGILDRI